jgi:hypothetical protein
MKIAVLFFLGLLLIVSCSDNPNDVANTEATDYFPLAKGSHWTYSVTDFDSLGNPLTVTDSEHVYVEDCNFIGGKNVYVLSINSPQFIQGKNDPILDYAQLSFNGSDLQLFCKALYPYIPLDTAECMSRMPERWINFSRFTSSQWSVRDSFAGDRYPIVTRDSMGNYVDDMQETAWIFSFNAKRENDEKISINGNTYNTVVHSFTGERILRIIHPDNIMLTPSPQWAGKYFDNGRSVIANEFTLKL